MILIKLVHRSNTFFMSEDTSNIVIVCSWHENTNFEDSVYLNIKCNRRFVRFMNVVNIDNEGFYYFDKNGTSLTISELKKIVGHE